MGKTVKRLSLSKMKRKMRILTSEERFSTIGGKSIYMDQSGVVVHVTDDHPGWTYLNIVESVYGAGYNKFKVLSSWYTQREINNVGGLGYNSFAGEGVAKDLFEFLTQNTSVEWGLHESDNKYSIIDTTHGESSLYPGCYQGYQGFYHNHQYTPNPSGSDYRAKDALQKYGYEYFGIYYEQNGHYYYY